MIELGNFADFLGAGGTIILALVAVFQEPIRRIFFRQRLQISIMMGPPDCMAVPITDRDGHFLANSVYLRILVKNVGRATAKNVEVYANALRLKGPGGEWRTLSSFVPMNLRWSDIGQMYFPRIAPGMAKHCDFGHVVDPQEDHPLPGGGIGQGSRQEEAVFEFDLIVSPNHGGHVIKPGRYRVDLLVASESEGPVKEVVELEFSGRWNDDQNLMLGSEISVRIVKDK